MRRRSRFAGAPRLDGRADSARAEDHDVAVLDGELAVPCSPQSASAGSNPHSEGGPCCMSLRGRR